MDYESLNQRSLIELRDFVQRLSDESSARVLHGDWTVSVTLAHLAFWDRYAVALLDSWCRDGFRAVSPKMFVTTSSEADSMRGAEFMSDFVNKASLPAWASLPVRWVWMEVLTAAEEADRRAATIPGDLIGAIVAGGMTRMLDRSQHRREHVHQLRQLFDR